MKKLLLLFLFSFLSFICFSQNTLDIKFVKYLADKESYKECIFELDKYDVSNFKQSYKDSIFYYKAWCQYAIKQLSASAYTFMSISKDSPFYEQSNMFAAYNLSHIGEYEKADLLYKEFLSNENENSSLINFEAAGTALLKRDFKAFDSYFIAVDSNKYFLQSQYKVLNSISKDLRVHSHKSPLWAAGMSCIVPGLGKIYTGKIGEGIVSFLTVGGLGLVYMEQYRKNGFSDYRSILTGGLFSLFYIGNIYGSYFSVLMSENEYNDENNNTILFNIHIPLRNFYK